MTATTSAVVATTSDRREAEGVSREEWHRTPHEYDLRYPQYPCAKCGAWPGHPIHQLTTVPETRPGVP